MTFPPPLGDGPTGGFGASSGSFEVGPSGEPIWRLPLVLPPGPPDMTPSLSLEYHPGSGQEFMPAGWTLGGLSVIARCPKNLAHDHVIDPVKLDATDNYCLDGRRLVPIADLGSTIEYRTQPDSFVRVVGYKDLSASTGNTKFELTTPNGIHRFYGEPNHADAHIWSNKTGPSGGTIALAWLIDRESSPATPATIDYTYDSTTTTTGTKWYAPLRISYSGRTITFGTKSTASSDFRFGWQPFRYVENTGMLSSISIGVAGATHTYLLDYAQGPRTGRSLVSDISETIGGPTSSSRRIAHFDWNGAPASTPHFTQVSTPVGSPYDPGNASLLLTDVTGDGLPDSVLLDDVLSVPWATVSAAGGPNKFYASQPAFAGPPGTPGHPIDRGLAMDYDQDGFDDFLLYGSNDVAPNQTWKLLHTVHGANNVVEFAPVDTHVPRPSLGNLPIPDSLRSEYASAHFADVNGDGVVDLIQCTSASHTHPSLWSVRYWVPTGSLSDGGRGFDSTDHVISGAGMEDYPCDVFVTVSDIDGDHRAELVVPTNQYVPNTFGEYTSPYRALGLRADGSWELLDTLLPLPPQPDPNDLQAGIEPDYSPSHVTTWVDLNGDGLPDAVQAGADPNNLQVFFNTGGVFTPPTTALATGLTHIADSVESAVAIDIDADGRQDLVVELFEPSTGTGGWVQLRSTGSPSTPLQLVPTLDLANMQARSNPLYFGFFKVPSAESPHLADIDGDGAPDLLQVQVGGGLAAQAWVNTFAEEDTLRSVTNGTNARAIGDPYLVPDVDITYGHLVDSAMTAAGGPVEETTPALESSTYLAHWDDTNNCSYPRRCTTGPRRVVSSYSLNDGEDRSRRYELRYRDGRTDVEGRGWLGFGARITVDQTTGAQTLETFDNVVSEPNTGDYPGAGIVQETRQWVPARPSDPNPSRVDISVSSATRVSYSFAHAGFPTTYFTVGKSRNTRTYQADFNPAGGLSMFQWVQNIELAALIPVSNTTTTYDSYDAYGNLHAATTTTAGVDLTTTRTRTYQNDTTGWILGRALTDNVCSTSGGITQCRNDAATYDAFGRPISHAFTATDTNLQDPNGGPNAGYTETFAYDAFGNLISILKSDNFSHTALTCAAYDAQGVSLQALRDPLNHTSFFQTDPRYGEVITEVDPNLVATQWSYDGWGRPAREVAATGKNTTTTFTQVLDPALGTVIRQEVKVVGGQDITTQYDASGRPTIVWSGTLGPYCPVPCPKSRTKQYAEYDPVHLTLSRVSIPVDESVASGTITMWSTWVRDAAGRITSFTPPWAGGVTRYTYADKTTTAMEPLGVTRKTTLDAAGRTIQVDEPAGTTIYSYGPFSEVTKIAADNLPTYQTYDPVGHVVSITTPDTGTTTTSYDGFGHPMVETNAIPRTTTYKIDVAGRMLSRTDADGLATWTWDTAPGAGIGQLASVTTAANSLSPIISREDYAYDATEELASHSLTVGGETFNMSFTYNLGALNTIAYPKTSLAQAFTIQNFYDPYGHLAQVGEVGKLPYWTLNAADNQGHTTAETFGNNVVKTTKTYLQDKGVVSSIGTQGAVALQRLSYVWDDRLNLSSRRDDLQPQAAFHQESFGYDTSDRLVCTAFSSSCSGSNINYDATGNIVSKKGIGAYTYDPAHPHAVQKAGTGTYVNDAVGNQIVRPDGKVVYNAVNLPKQIIPNAGPTSNYLYDGLEDRIQKTTPTDTTVYMGGLFERVTRSTGVRDYYYSVRSGERVVAVINRRVTAGVASELVNFIHDDHLGSPDVISNAGGGLAEARSFDAFGAPRNADWSISTPPAAPNLLPVGYSAQENDNLGLVDMKGRTYDPRLGRMLQADPYVSHPGSLQGWNRYAYVLNNPLKYVDPSGFQEAQAPVFGRFADEKPNPRPAPTQEAPSDSDPSPGSLADAPASGDGSIQAPTTDVAPIGPPPPPPPSSPIVGAHGEAKAGARSTTERAGAPKTDTLGFHIWAVATCPFTVSNPIGGIAADAARIAMGQQHVSMDQVVPTAREGAQMGVEAALSLIPAVGEELGLLARAAGRAPIRQAIGATGRVGEEALRALGGESQVFFRTSRGARFVDQLVNGIAYESKVGYTTLTPSIRNQIAKDAELIATRQIQGASWHFFRSPITGLGGPSEPLRQALEGAGIEVVVR